MRHIAIVGSGIGGCALALALRHHYDAAQSPAIAQQLQVDVYEQYSGQLDAPAGAAFNLNGGAAVLCDLGLSDVLRRLSNPMARVLSRTVSGQLLMDLDIPGIVRDEGASTQLTRDNRLQAVTVLRSELLGCLAQKAFAPGGAARLVQGAQVAGVSNSGSLCLTDGSFTETTYDLVVAADGLRSTLRTGLDLSPAPPRYSNIRIAFAVAPRAAHGTVDPLRACPPTEVHQWFASNGYCLVYTAGGGAEATRDAGAGAHCLALCWREEATASENSAWGAQQGAKDAMLRRLKVGGFPAEVLRLCEASTRVVELGVYGHSPSPGPWWRVLAGTAASPHVVLLGDAVHAMPPFLGQGANQAIQDAWCLARHVAAVGAPSGKAGSLGQALAAYEALRRPPTAALQVSSAAIGLLDTLPAPLHLFRDLALWIAAQAGIAGKVFVNGALPRV